MLNFEEIKKLVPQRYPFLMLDKVLELEKGKRIVVIKNVSGNEPYFLGHFPEKAIMPGAFIIEGMGQAAIILFRLSQEDKDFNNEEYYFGFASAKARFLKPVFPGDQIVMEIKMVKMISDAAVIKGVATVDGEVVTKGTMSFAVREISKMDQR